MRGLSHNRLPRFSSHPLRGGQRRVYFHSFPLWPYGAFVNGGAEEITTFGGGRGAARLLTLLLFVRPSVPGFDQDAQW